MHCNFGEAGDKETERSSQQPRRKVIRTQPGVVTIEAEKVQGVYDRDFRARIGRICQLIRCEGEKGESQSFKTDLKSGSVTKRKRQVWRKG